MLPSSWTVTDAKPNVRASYVVFGHKAGEIGSPRGRFAASHHLDALTLYAFSSETGTVRQKFRPDGAFVRAWIVK